MLGPVQGASTSSVRVLGQGYVGLPLAIVAAESGCHVVGVETDSTKVQQLLAGNSYVEDVPSDRLRAALDSGRYVPTDDDALIENFDVAVISVPTPLRDQQPDLTYVVAAAGSIAPHVRPGSTVILESTTYPGTTEEIVGPILETHSGLHAGSDFYLGYSPERLDPGNSAWPLQAIPKVVSGAGASSLVAVQAFFRSIGIPTVAAQGTREAELAKLLENTFRHVNIALVNELAIFSHELGINVWDAIGVAATKPFGFMPFSPGPGVGGHCLPIDPSYLSWRVERHLGHTFRFVELANDVNQHMPEYVVRRVAAGLNRRALPLKDSVVVLLGLTYKPGTADTRESPTYRVASLLMRQQARVVVVDPRAADAETPAGASRGSGGREELMSADAVVLLVDHQEFDLSQLEHLPGLVLDCRGVTTHPSIERI